MANTFSLSLSLDCETVCFCVVPCHAYELVNILYFHADRIYGVCGAAFGLLPAQFYLFYSDFVSP